MSKFTALLADPYARRRYQVELYPFDPALNAVRALYFSDDGFVSEPGDTPANTWFEARVMTALSFTRSLFAEGRLGGKSIPGFGALQLANADGGLDYLAGLAWDGRRVVVRLGGDGFAYADCAIIFDGTADDLEWSADTVTVRLRDLQYKIDRPLLTARFAGTGGWEGGADLADKAKPRLFGLCRNVEPVLVDAAGLRYQVNAGAVAGIDAVRDKGAALTFAADYPSLAALDAAVIPSGGFATCKAAGCIRLSSPPDGLITADVRGDAAGGYAATAAGIIRRIALTAGGLSAADIDEASFAALDALQPAALGLYAADEMTVMEALDQIADAVGAWYGFDRSGKMNVGRVDPPAGLPVADYTDREILSFERLSTKLPVWRLALGYRRNWRLMAGGDLAARFLPGGANAADGAWFQKEYRTVSASDAAVQTRHLLARDERWDTLLDEAAAAQAECNRLHAMFKADRDFFRVRVKTQPFLRDLGQEVRLSPNRYGLAAGRNFIVVSLTEDSAVNEVEMEVWG